MAYNRTIVNKVTCNRVLNEFLKNMRICLCVYAHIIYIHEHKFKASYKKQGTSMNSVSEVYHYFDVLILAVVLCF